MQSTTSVAVISHRATTLQLIPYQGSKRKLAAAIMAFAPSKFIRLVEPFAGSAAISLFAALNGMADRYLINDSYKPLTEVWRLIIESPEETANRYENLWKGQAGDPISFYYKVREEFNKDQDPIKFLFLIARCAKNSIRFNSSGGFNQSPDKRRLGRSPAEMRQQMLQTAHLLRNKVKITNADYFEVLKNTSRDDLVYMDPPYQGTSTGRNPRYHQGLDLGRFIGALEMLVDKKISFLLSFDGRCGDRTYGEELPKHLGLRRIDIHAGRSAQATLNGRVLETVESLYVSPDLIR